MTDRKLVVIGFYNKLVVEEDVNELKRVWKRTFDW